MYDGYHSNQTDKTGSKITIQANLAHISPYILLRKTVFHEFFHAVMASYGYDKIIWLENGVDYLKWFRESFGQLAELFGDYLGSTFSFSYADNNNVKDYLQSYSKSLYWYGDTTRYYGTVVTFPYQLYFKLGGWNVIRGMLNNIQSLSLDDYSSYPPELVYSAMSVVGYTSNYSAILSGISFNCYRPCTYYGANYTGTTWNTTVKNYITANTSYGVDTGQKQKIVQPLSFNYLEYQNNGTPFNAIFTVSAFYPGIKLNVIKTDSSGGIHKATISSEMTSTINISVQNFGGSSVQTFTIVPVNFNTHGTPNYFNFKLSTQ